MVYRELGKTGIKVSAIALGCEGFMDKDADSVRKDFDFAIAEGINFVDIYSSNPDLRSNIGYALKGRREGFAVQAHLCSVWERGQYLRTRNIDKTKREFGLLLRQLDTDYLDVGMIHYVDNEKDFHKIFDGPIIQFAQQLKRDGVIRSLGLSSHNPIIAKMAVETGLIDVLMFSINPCYDMQPPTDDVEELWADKNYENPLQNIAPERENLYALCESKGVGIDVMKVYGGGDLLSEVNSPFGKALTTVQCIEYALTRPAVAAVMVGCRTVDEIKQAAGWCEATVEQRDYTQALTHLGKYTWKGHCMYCGHCAPCTSAIDIAMVNKLYNLTVAEGMVPETVADHYRLLKHHASECIACGQCETRCPFGVKIVEGMKKAKDRFGY
jgi:predicted aldo/keto reductase-like oxidoreductase